MKKIFTTCAAVLAFFMASAQTNLGIQYAHYTNGQTFSKDTIRTKFIITNYGSNNYSTGDTLFVNATLNGVFYSLDLFTADATPIVLTRALNTGDTLHYNPGIIFGSQTLPFFPGATTLDVCMILWGKGKSSIKAHYVGDSDSTNNKTCVTYDPNFVTNIAKNTDATSLRTFPNPATNQITFDLANQPSAAGLRITDMNGRLIIEIKNMRDAAQTVNTSSWNNGIYLYQLMQNGGNVIRGKFFVNN